MKIIVDILHPAHVHVLRNFIKEMEKRGHKVLVTARKKEMALKLLDLYNIKYQKISDFKGGVFSRFFELLIRDYKFYKIAKKFQPDILIGLMGATIATTGVFLKSKTIVLWDTEVSGFSNSVVYRLADAVYVPSCYEGPKIGNLHKYNGYHELAYLHPKRFKPNKKILKEVGLKNKDKFFVVRFVAWQAAHDTGGKGFTNKLDLIKKLEKYGKVFISSESPLPKELEKYKLHIQPHKIHDLMAFATMYIGESATMASEAACLGIPAIFVSSSKRGYTNEQEKKYGLVYNFSEQEPAIKKALELLKRKNLKKEWQIKRNKMLKDKIDVTEFIINTVEKYNN